MASSTPGPDQSSKVKMRLNPSRKPARVIGRIRGFTDKESESLSLDSSKPWITVSKPQDHGDSSETRLTLSFLDQFNNSKKEASYKLDYCYEQDEDNGTLFAREVEPLISDVLNGGNASILAYGARGSGKTYTIQGSEGKPGIAGMAMTELLSKAEKTGKSVSLSIFEVHQEHAYDLLNPKNCEVQVLEDCKGKINLKGLSQVSVKSILEFQDIYFSKLNISESVQKIPLEHSKKSHKCLMLHVSAVDDNSNCKLVGKMNFVDLAGYEDARRTSRDGGALLEVNRTNKSLHAVLNVVYALNANEIHVPYRGSKLTHMFKESLGATSRVLVLTCLNPHFCQDTLHTLSLASWSHQSTNIVLTDSTRSAISSARFKMLSSQNTVKPFCTPPTLRKQAVSSVHLSTMSTSCVSKGRKLFEEGKKITSNQTKTLQDESPAKKLDFLPETAVTMTPSMKKKASQDETISDDHLALIPEEVVSQDKLISEYTPDLEFKENDISAHNRYNNFSQVICEKSPIEDGKEQISLPTNESGSPPLSERLRQLSNSLKSFCSSTPLRVNMVDNSNIQHSVQAGCAAALVEPKTPSIEYATGVTERLDSTKYSSPWEILSKRSSGMKDSLIQEFLRFLNSASKEELKGLRGIGEKRATYILELREESPEPFQSLDDLQEIGLTAKQVRGMMKKMAGDFFS